MIIKVLAVAFLLTLGVIGVKYQRSGNTTNPTTIPVQNSNTSAPFDGGLTLLVAAGVGLAVKKRFDKKKAA